MIHCAHMQACVAAARVLFLGAFRSAFLFLELFVAGPIRHSCPHGRGSRLALTRIAAMKVAPCEKRISRFEVSLCLSRACLGKNDHLLVQNATKDMRLPHQPTSLRPGRPPSQRHRT